MLVGRWPQSFRSGGRGRLTQTVIAQNDGDIIILLALLKRSSGIDGRKNKRFLIQHDHAWWAFVTIGE